MKNLSVVLVLALFGCGVGVVQTGDAADDAADSLSSVTAGFVTLARDLRKCAAPACGGYWLTQPSHPSIAPIYVSDLDFSGARGLSSTDADGIRAAPAAELLLYGKLTRADASGLKRFLVQDAYRGMPNRAPASTDGFYAVKNNGKTCIAAPCNALTGTKLNSTALPKDFTTLSVASAAGSFVDQAWLSHRAIDGGAIVTGKYVKGTVYATGTELVLDATQVFLHLPESSGACPTFQVACSNPQLETYERDQDRCVVPTGCAAQTGFCPQYMPACETGYTLQSWRGHTGCNHYACDPSWLFGN